MRRPRILLVFAALALCSGVAMAARISSSGGGGGGSGGSAPVKVTYDAGIVASNDCTAYSVSVTGATVGDFVSVNAAFALELGLSFGNAYVSSAGVVTFSLCNSLTFISIDPASGVYNFRLER